MRTNTFKAIKQSLQRHVHARTAPRDLYEIGCDAPLNRPVQVKVRDVLGSYILPFPVARTDTGWINAGTGSPLCERLTIVGWRHRAW